MFISKTLQGGLIETGLCWLKSRSWIAGLWQCAAGLALQTVYSSKRKGNDFSTGCVQVMEQGLDEVQIYKSS